jgi:RNA polymerase sigma-70 factor (ECF subfamily)
MTYADDPHFAADEAFAALVTRAQHEVDTVVAVSLDVEDMLTRIKQRAANSHARATQNLRQEQKELQVVGASLTLAFSAPCVEHLPRLPGLPSPKDQHDDVTAAAMLRPDDGVRPVQAEGYAEASWDLPIIVADAVRGDRAAVELLLSYIRPLIVRYCRARVGRQERSFASADDVAQEVCLSVLTALSSYRDQGRPFLAFVYGIAAHKVAEAHRAAARNRAEPVAEVPDKPELGGSPQQRAMRAEMTARMAELLQVLPEKQREILVLRVVVGLSAEETADAVGSTPGAVRVAQHRALARLRTAASRLDLL